MFGMKGWKDKGEFFLGASSAFRISFSESQASATHLFSWRSAQSFLPIVKHFFANIQPCSWQNDNSWTRRAQTEDTSAAKSFIFDVFTLLFETSLGDTIFYLRRWWQNSTFYETYFAKFSHVPLAYISTPLAPLSLTGIGIPTEVYQMSN